MQVIEAQRASILVPRDHLHINHSQISMTSRYAHVVPQPLTDAAERIGRALWGDA